MTTMTKNHPITPPLELVESWRSQAPAQFSLLRETFLATQAARWGADMELDACCEYITGPGKWFVNPKFRLAELRAARRPQPPSLAEEGQRILVENGSTLDGRVELDPEDVATIRAALERLQELEKGDE